MRHAARILTDHSRAGVFFEVPVSGSSGDDVAPSLSRDQALARFHVMQPDGTLVSGGRAFAELWAALPGFRPWGRLFRNQPLTWVLNRAYDFFLRFRPKLQTMMAEREARSVGALPAWLVRDLRSDHAGEMGAVAIYRGILAVSRKNEIRSFAETHLRTEQQHLELIETILPRNTRSTFLPLWRVAGFVTGAIPAFFGAEAVFATVEAVETFVDRHYAEQIQRLSQEGANRELLALLERCRKDEARHRDEAREALNGQPGALLRGWCWLVGAGSAAAVAMARRF
jgi:demethoxyubiquinone hydroxylase (CLK1/Coq7/Cat5 family)